MYTIVVLFIIVSSINTCYGYVNNINLIKRNSKKINTKLNVISPTIIELAKYKPVIESSLVVASIIAIHELGHFFAARVQGIKVSSFNIGYGPPLISVKDKYETEFNLRLLPLGGYVAFPPDLEVDQITGEVIGEIDDPDLLQRRNPFERALVIAGGVIANILLTFVLSSVTSYTSGIGHPVFDNGIMVTQTPQSETRGYSAGLKVNDIILQVNDIVLPASDFATAEFVKTAKNNPNKPINMIVKRSDKIISLKGIPDDKGVLGIRVNNVILSVDVEKSNNIFEAVKIGIDETGRLIYITASSFYKAVQGGLSGGELGGPIQVVKTGADLAKVSDLALVGFAATLSVNLAIINSLPVPGLDGGQFLFVIIEILGIPLNRNLKDTITAIAFSLLLWLGLTSFIGDFSRINSSTPTTIIKNVP